MTKRDGEGATKPENLINKSIRGPRTSVTIMSHMVCVISSEFNRDV